jgi:flavin-dependent dehydrogenase
MSPERFHAERAGGLERLHRTVLAEAAPELAQGLEQSPAAVKLRAFAGERSFCRRPAGPGWALVGDAGCFRDPLTAHGITDALRDAELLARAAAEDTPAAYRAFHELRDQMARPLLDITDRIASLAWTLDEVKQLHRDLNRSMKAEVDLLTGLDAPAEAPTPSIGPVSVTRDGYRPPVVRLRTA